MNTRRKAFRTTIAVLLAIGFAVPAGVRVRNALAKRRDVDAERETARRASRGPSVSRTSESVRGVETTWRPMVSVDGSLLPLREVDLAFKATGTMATLRVKLGDRVKAGDVLATLDASEAYAQHKVVLAQIASAESQLEVATDHERRISKMVELGAVPESTGLQTKGQLNVAQSQLEGTKAQASLASAILRNHVLTAPFSGFVTIAPTSAGGLIAPGVPVFHLKDTSSLRLVGSIAERDAVLAVVGAKVAIEVPAGDGTKIVDAKLTTILPAVDTVTRRVPIEAELANDPNAPILAGIMVHASIAGSSAIRVLRFPGSVLRPGSQDEVMVVEGGKLRARRIVFTVDGDGSLLVRSGVSTKDDVLLVPTSEARDGDVVVKGGAS